MTGNMLIAQSGGPSMVINQSLVGAVLAAKASSKIVEIYGALHGIQGILDEAFVDLRAEPEEVLLRVAQTPSSALGSVRRKPTPEDCRAIFAILARRDIRYFFYIGGNDSAETANIIAEEAGRQGYDLRCFHIPKTIDNDLLCNDHTPGYGSAARFVACAVRGDDLDNRALGGVKIDEEKISDSWLNRHLKYTHGYGITLSRVDQVTSSGQPEVLIGNIPPESSVEEIQITRPEIYFGELSNEYVIVGNRHGIKILSGAAAPRTYKLYSTNGIIVNTTQSAATNVTLEQPGPGIYILQIEERNKQMHTQKIIIN